MKDSGKITLAQNKYKRNNKDISEDTLKWPKKNQRHKNKASKQAAVELYCHSQPASEISKIKQITRVWLQRGE